MPTEETFDLRSHYGDIFHQSATSEKNPTNITETDGNEQTFISETRVNHMVMTSLPLWNLMNQYQHKKGLVLLVTCT